MSLYREAGRPRWEALLAGALVALAVGGLAGFLVGAAQEAEPSLAAALSQLRGEVRPVTDSLDLLPIEYGQGVRGGRIVAPTEYEAASASLERAHGAFTGARADLAALDPHRTREAELQLEQLAALVERRAPLERVASAARRTQATINAAARAGVAEPG